MRQKTGRLGGKGKKRFFFTLLVGIVLLLCGNTVLAADTIEVNVKGFHYYNLAYDVFQLVNQQRTKNGLPTLSMNEQLQEDAMRRARELAILYSHTRPNGQNYSTAISGSWRLCGENIAVRQADDSALMNTWMNSEEQRANILKNDFQQIGVGCLMNNDEYYWVLLFTDTPSENTRKTGYREVKEPVETLPSHLKVWLGLWASLGNTKINTGRYGELRVPKDKMVKCTMYQFNQSEEGLQYGLTSELDSLQFSLNDAVDLKTDRTIASVNRNGEYTSRFDVSGLEEGSGALSIWFTPDADTRWCVGNGTISVYHKHTPGPAANCASDQICLTCKTVLMPKLSSHNWDDWSDYKAATVSSPKIMKRTCKVCGATETKKTGSPLASDKKVKSVKVRGKTTLLVGKKITLKATVSPTDVRNKTVAWSTSNKKYATVSSKGVVTAKAAGAGKTVTITAKAKDGSGKKASLKIKIKGAVTKIKLTAPKTVKAGKKATIKAAVTVGKGGSKALTWSSSDKKYATVTHKGVVKTMKAGKGKTVTITAKAKDGSGKKASVKIKIK